MFVRNFSPMSSGFKSQWDHHLSAKEFLHSKCALDQVFRLHSFGAGSSQDPVARKGVRRSFDIVLGLRSAVFSHLFFGAKIARIESRKTDKTDPSEVSHKLTENETLFGVRFFLPIKEKYPLRETLFGRYRGVRFLVRLSQGGIAWSCAL